MKGLLGSDDRGFWFDLSRVLKGGGDGMSYGLAMHAGATQSGWLDGGRSPLPGNRTVYRAGIGPSIMVKGITASTQFGIYTDGIETMQHIRKLPRGRDLPMIAVTAKAMKGDRDKCIEAGAWDYMAKPVDSMHMLYVLRGWLCH